MSRFPWLERAVLRAGALCVTGFAAIVVWVVASRYLLGITPRWAEELPRLLLVWLAFLGSAAAFSRGTHFRAGILPLLLGEGPARRVLGAVAVLASVTFLAVLVVTGWRLAMLTWGNGTTALGLPVGLFYLSLPVTGVLALALIAAGGWRK